MYDRDDDDVGPPALRPDAHLRGARRQCCRRSDRDRGVARRRRPRRRSREPSAASARRSVGLRPGSGGAAPPRPRRPTRRARGSPPLRAIRDRSASLAGGARKPRAIVLPRYARRRVTLPVRSCSTARASSAATSIVGGCCSYSIPVYSSPRRSRTTRVPTCVTRRSPTCRRCAASSSMRSIAWPKLSASSVDSATTTRTRPARARRCSPVVCSRSWTTACALAITVAYRCAAAFAGRSETSGARPAAVRSRLPSAARRRATSGSVTFASGSRRYSTGAGIARRDGPRTRAARERRRCGRARP